MKAEKIWLLSSPTNKFHVTWWHKLCIWSIPKNLLTFRIGTGIRPVSDRMANLSSVTGVLSGAPFSFQSGISSFKAGGSRQAPDNVWPPAGKRGIKIKYIILYNKKLWHWWKKFKIMIKLSKKVVNEQSKLSVCLHSFNNLEKNFFFKIQLICFFFS